MIARAMVLLCVALLVVPAYGQATQPTPVSVNSTSTGTVTGTDVNVRSGPSMTDYICTKVHKPATVTVVGIVKASDTSGEWAEILPPPGAYSVISKQYVTKDASGASGIVSGDAVWTHPAGDMRSGDFWGLHPKLNKGDKVAILGEVGEYYKITPPAGAHFFVTTQFLNVTGVAGTGTGPTTAPGDATGPRTITIVRTTTRPAPVPVELSDLEKAEKDLLDEFKKPSDQIDVNALIKKYQALTVTDATSKEWVDYRIAYLKNILDRRSARESVDKTIQEELDRQAKAQRELTNMQTSATTQMALPERYAAQGVVMTSGLFTGSGAVRVKRYVVRDPVTQRVDAYIQSSDGKVSLEDFIGKHVGVKGDAVYDEGLRLNVVEAKEVIILADKTDMPLPAKPLVKEALPAPTGPAALPVRPVVIPVAPKVTPAPEPTLSTDKHDMSAPVTTPTTAPATAPAVEPVAPKSAPLPPINLKPGIDEATD